MLYALTLLAPLVLLGLMLVMERVERPLRRDAVGEHLIGFLETARPEEVETYVSEGFGPALDRYWRRRQSASKARRAGETAQLQPAAQRRGDPPRRSDAHADVPAT